MSSSAATLRVETPPTDKRPLAGRLAAAIVGKRDDEIPAAARDKLRICLLDFLACAFEASSLPWARQAAALATAGAGPCSIVGTSLYVPAGDAVFANSVAGHGLVREDMHTGSVSHLGIVVLPPLLALAQQHRVDGRQLLERDPGRVDPLRSRETEWAGALRPHRIHKQVVSRHLYQHRGVTDHCDP